MKTLSAEVHDYNNLSYDDFVKNFKVINNTERGIYLFGREGYVARIEPTRNPQLASGVYFSTEITVRGQVKTDADSILSEVDQSNRPSGRMLQKSKLEGFTRVREELLDCSSSSLFYVVEHDIAIGFNEPTDGMSHPFSAGGIVDFVTNGERKREANGALDITIDIIDNEGTFGDRYISVGGTAFAVKARKDSTLESGIYSGWTNHIRINGESLSFGLKRFSFAELETSKEFPFTLYKSPDDAKGFDPAKQLEMTLTEAKGRLDILKTEREEASAWRKDYYEQRSLSRKDNSDGWKMLPAFVLGVATLVKIIF